MKNFDVPNAKSVGAYAFAYCSSLKSLNLIHAEEIGYYAIAGSGIKDLFVGNGTSIDEQSSLDLDCVHGYRGTAEKKSDAEKLEQTYGCELDDLTLKITSDLNSTIIVKDGETANFGFRFKGFGVTQTVFLNGQAYVGKNISAHVFGEDFDEKWTVFSVSNLSNALNTFKVELEDEFGDVKETRTMQIVVVKDDTDTFSITQHGQDFELSISDETGEVVSDSQNFYKSKKYILEIKPRDGFVIDEVTLNEAGKEPQIFHPNQNLVRIELQEVSSDIEIEVQTSQKTSLEVKFDVKNGGRILVEGAPIGDSIIAERNSSISFKVDVPEGFTLKRVLLDGQRLEETAPNEFTIPDITKDLNVVVLFDEILSKVTVSRGKGGNLNGDFESYIAYGEERTYHVTANEGYSIDSVTVNGKTVEVKDGNFVVQGGLEDCNIVVSFKKNGESIFASDSVGLVYFFIFLAILFVFIVAKIILSAVRKKNKKKRKTL